jgi:lysophospholipase L1-like esterase
MKKAWMCLYRPRVGPLLAALLLTFLLLSIAIPSAAAAGKSAWDKQVGAKQYYLALGDSLAFGYQPDKDYQHGYADLFAQDLKKKGVKAYANMSCVGESSFTMITGLCPYSALRKYPYQGSQLQAATNYIKQHSGQVSPVTLSIGANDILMFFDPATCKFDQWRFQIVLAMLDANLKRVILPALKDALTVKGKLTGDILLTNIYDPFQNACPDTVSYINTINAHLAQDIEGTGALVDIFRAYGGARVPNKQICNYSWYCAKSHDIHPTDKGYQVIEATLKQGKYKSV